MDNRSTNEEIDLVYLFKKGNEIFRKFLIGAYNFILLLIRNWIVIFSLIIIGVILGYYGQKDFQSSKSSEAIVRVNFNLGSYVYNSVELLNDKINNRDSIFLKEFGLWEGQPLIKKLEITPIISFNELVENYGNNNKTFEILLDKYEFEGDDSASKVFNFEYKLHRINLKLSNNATPKTINNLLGYFNTNDLLSNFKVDAIEINKKFLEANLKSIELIDKLFLNYSEQQITNSVSNQVVLDKDLSGLVEKKNYLLDLNISLQYDIALSEDITVLINRPELIEEKPGTLGNKMLRYPIFLVLIFIVTLYLRKWFFTAQQMAKEAAEK
ncbi:MAG: hypothetical protein K8F54_07835 [Altibacter sp.]|uniref:hypothetical protein n=1 Tax=Altibacter sp. TaxID=2024823 RepID=UPI001DAE6B8F|nr:hypothetical protein [Altibacter sp.]MBZ0327500.1 hypothetical protein [Altibacter sp.]